jgi:protease-4
MKSFFKIFFASILALLVFTIIGAFILIFMIARASSHEKPYIGDKGILVLDLGVNYREQAKDNTLNSLFGGDASDNVPGLYDVVRMLHYAKYDTTIKGLFIKAGQNANGFATSEELRKAVLDFKQSKKFVIAYGEYFSQKDYYVATAADKIYCNPNGGVDWGGFSVNLYFLKGLLDKLEIEPEVFYAGKFKSATEPFRVTQMTDANRLQTNVWLGDLYSDFLQTTSEARNIDTAKLHQLANDGAIQTANDALTYKLVDGLKYDDEIRAILLKRTAKQGNEVNFVALGKYADAVDFSTTGDDEIAVIYAQGDIVSGKNTNSNDEKIASDDFVKMIRKVRQDDNVKAIVFRVNSPGGSSLASDDIWREISLAKKDKPVVVSMGDYAASGGYYISCNGDSIFADRGTITGSIGVFSLLPNMQGFFKNKLGITFDGVKTAQYADMGSSSRPLTENEKRFLQNDVNGIYAKFLSRVASGRNRDTAYIDSIAQGRVWTGKRAIGIGLVDKTGTLQDAVDCAARMAKLKAYKTGEYPEHNFTLKSLLQGSLGASMKADAVKENIGEKQYQMLMQAQKVQQMFGVTQTRLPFEFDIR